MALITSLLSTTSLSALISTFLASLLGSLHCAAMCGGFVGYCAAHSRQRAIAQGAYHIGRLLTYCLLGGIAGFFGSIVNLGAYQVGIQRGAALFAGVFLIYWGAKGVFTENSPSLIQLSPASPDTPPSRFKKFLNFNRIKRAYALLMQPSPNARWGIRSLAIGTLSGLLPCGWLYSFVVLAAASGTIIGGALTMLAFWLGTVPILTAVGSTLSIFARIFGRQLPRVTAAFVLIAGLFSLTGHFYPALIFPSHDGVHSGSEKTGSGHSCGHHP
ncbi:MAG: sulfite exporter TauE/SafE family protein [Bdellovibrionales bacterium]|nr:sulfite exporter TauE/SafE family protein [Bdellovibrionales bacterium]